MAYLDTGLKNSFPSTTDFLSKLIYILKRNKQNWIDNQRKDYPDSKEP